MLNKFQIEILNGSLLSDGCITKVPKCINYYWTQTTKYSEYADYLQECINIFSNRSVVKPVSRVFPNGKTYNTAGAFTIKTKTSEFFTNYRELWYPSGIKTVPDNIILTPTTVLHWYLGDGNLDQINGISLCTDSFSQYDNQRLVDLLNKITIAKLTNKNRIHIPNKGVWEFLQYIGKCPVECFEYKWDTIVTRSYYGRRCESCESFFDASQNHQRFCSSKCCQRAWKKSIIEISQTEKPSHQAQHNEIG